MKPLILTPYVNAALKLLNAFPVNVPRHCHSKFHLQWGESESDVASRWVHRKSNLMFTLSSEKRTGIFAISIAFAQCN